MGDPDPDKDDNIQCDSVGFNDPIQLSEEMLRQQLIDISEELTEMEFKDMKFCCYDIVPAAKLEKASSALDVFDLLKKVAAYSPINLNFILELLCRIHRYDLVRMLGYDVDAVRANVHTFQNISPLRVMEMEIADDMESVELEKMKFLLAEQIKKRKLMEVKTPYDLFILMEQEGLINSGNVSALIDILAKIKREDLADNVRKYAGHVPKSSVAGFQRPTRPQNTENQRMGDGREVQRRQEMLVREGYQPYPGQLMTGLNQQHIPNGGPAAESRNTQHTSPAYRPPPLAHSASAGTISVSDNSNSRSTPESPVIEIPQGLFLQITEDVKNQFDNLGIDLGYSNAQLGELTAKYPDPAERTRQLLSHWQAQKIDKGQIAPGLYFVLTKLGCKTAAESMKQWISCIGQQTDHSETVQRVNPNPGLQRTEENNYTSLQEARLDPARDTAGQGSPMTQLQQQIAVKSSDTAPPVGGVGQQVYPQLTQAIIDQLQRITSMQAPDHRNQTATSSPQNHEIANIDADPAIDTASMDFPTYRMDRQPRGWCIIVNNQDFYIENGDRQTTDNNQNPQNKPMPSRIGTEKDAQSLQFIFDKLGFVVRRRDNLSDTEMMQYMVEVAHNVDHSKFDCLVVCILTHGVLNHVYGSNGRLLAVKDITAVFQANRCPTLAGKPKLFFLQACQGRDKMEGKDIERDAPTVVGPNDEDEEDDRLYTDQDKQEFIPNEADFLLGYATVPGYVSFRSRNHGSWYIRKLCELLEKHAARHHLMDILVEVNREVALANAELEGGKFKQIPAPFVTLRKRLFFR